MVNGHFKIERRTLKVYTNMLIDWLVEASTYLEV